MSPLFVAQGGGYAVSMLHDLPAPWKIVLGPFFSAIDLSRENFAEGFNGLVL